MAETGASATSGVRPRADAVRNRKAVLDAARSLFAECGLDSNVEEVAARARVGVGTVYRHFPSKALLVDAVFDEILHEVAALADEALARHDPWEGFAWFVERVAALSAGNRGLRGVMRSRVHESESLGASWAAGADRIERLVGRAQAQGAMRADVGLADVRAVLWGAAEVAEMAARVAPALWHRHLHLLLDGLRAEAATPMPVAGVGRARARTL
jgi:AcrR family transcriptional regulator